MLNELYPDSHVYCTRTAYAIRGDLDVHALERSLDELVRRHDVLRTTFDVIDGQPRQIVGLPGPVPLPIFDVSNATLAELKERVHAEGIRPYDLRRGPLMRAALFCRGPLEHVLLVGMHHIVIDEGSKPTFNRELTALYEAYHRRRQLELPGPRVQYRDYALWQRESMPAGELEQQLSYWRAQLADAPARIELPLDRPRPAVAQFRGAIKATVLSRTSSERIRELGRTHGATFSMTMLAAFNVLLYRYTGQSDLVVGLPVANRSRTEFEDVIGLFVNTVALRTHLRPESTFRDVLRAVRETAISAYDNQDLPFERVVAEVHPERNLSGTPLVNVLFLGRSSTTAPLELDGLELQQFPVQSTTARFDLTMRVTDAPGGIECSLQYDVDLFDLATIERFLGHYANLLESFVAGPEAIDMPIARVAMLSADDYRALVVDANQTQVSYPADKTIPQLFTEQAARSPDSVAVACGETTLTYAQLDAASNRLARALAGRGITAGSRVGIFVDRSPGLIVGLLAILKSGSAYVPLDPTYPLKRLEFIAADSGLAAVVTQSWREDAFLSEGTTLRVDLDAPAIALEDPGAMPSFAANPCDVAYSIYTSGSTGTPKAVDVPHRAVVNLLWALRERPGLAASDTLLALTTICFDLSVFEMFAPLVVGAKLVIATDDVAQSGTAILELLSRSKATVMLATPVTWQLLIDAGWRGGTARKLLCSGEPLTRVLADQLLARGDEVWNLYGPTETTVFSSVARVGRGAGAVPIGSPISNTQYYILDVNGELGPPEIPGELYIGGDGVALGYHAREELTRARFVPDRFGPKRDGRLYRTGDIVRMRGSNLEFLGRSDQQIKLRGFRIELDEISAALRAQAGVADAVTIVVDDPRRGPEIRAYVVRGASTVPAPDSELSTMAPGSDLELAAVVPSSSSELSARLRTEIGSTLPRYMMPAAIVVLDALPRLSNGKIDRRALAERDSDTANNALDTVATELEGRVADIVSNLLGHSHVGVRDDLFGIGLHSVLALQLVARIEKDLGVPLSLQSVFENPTVRGLAHAMNGQATLARAAEPTHPVVALNVTGRETPLFFLHHDEVYHGAYTRRLAAALGPAQPIYAVAPHGTAGLPEVLSVEAMAADYYKLLKDVQPTGPYRIAGFCVGGLVAFELARLLVSRGDAVERLIIINKDAPLRARIPGFDAFVRRAAVNTRLDTDLRRALIEIPLLLPLALERGLGTMLRALYARLGRRVPEFAGRIGHATGDGAETLLRGRIIRVTYHPKKYDGEVTLIWSSGKELKAIGNPTGADATIGWGALATAVNVIPMSGDHHSPIRERVAELGSILSEVLS